MKHIYFHNIRISENCMLKGFIYIYIYTYTYLYAYAKEFVIVSKLKKSVESNKRGAVFYLNQDNLTRVRE